ncbi:MAG TPA: type IV pilus modification protein PilV [Steroidobacteraceae bacterium]|nr:type IV pilus modification protein PilV [Steroidobacteraceae bacterium]
MNHLQMKSRARGFSLVEVLVALVVMAVGMLGVCSLFVVSFHSGATAVNRINAVNLAAELADRIRANHLARGAYAGAGANNDCMGATKQCSAQDLAAYDLYGWYDTMNKTLPGSPSATVTVTPGGTGVPDTYLININWSEPHEDMSYTLLTKVSTT